MQLPEHARAGRDHVCTRSGSRNARNRDSEQWAARVQTAGRGERRGVGRSVSDGTTRWLLGFQTRDCRGRIPRPCTNARYKTSAQVLCRAVSRCSSRPRCMLWPFFLHRQTLLDEVECLPSAGVHCSALRLAHDLHLHARSTHSERRAIFRPADRSARSAKAIVCCSSMHRHVADSAQQSASSNAQAFAQQRCKTVRVHSPEPKPTNQKRDFQGSRCMQYCFYASI
jgi:hypothetical protein